MSLPREPLFLARQIYRRRRIADAARGLPVLGVFLFLMPLLAAGQGRNDTGGWLVYVFVIWLALIVVAAVLSRWLGQVDMQDGQDGRNTSPMPPPSGQGGDPR